MDCPKGSGSGSAVGDLPEGPLVDILSRVPAKSVLRFKCVSIGWLDLIADPHHRKKLSQAMQGLFCHTAKKSGAGQSYSYSFSFIDLVPRSVPLDIDPSFSFLTKLPEIRSLLFRDSCNGLILFDHRQEMRSVRLGYIVCNPTTKEWKHVPACGSSTFLTYPYLAFDPAVSSHFHLVQFEVKDEEEPELVEFLSVRVYSSETGTWGDNQIEEQGEEGQLELEGWRQFSFFMGSPPSLDSCPFINGFLHLIVLNSDHVRKIVALDVQGKVRRIIPVPHVDDDRSRMMCYFGESQGQLHYMTQESLNIPESVTREALLAHEWKYKLSIWVLQDYDAQEWVLKGTVNTDEVFGENTDRRGRDFKVVALHQHCNVAFFTQSLSKKLVAYNMGSKEVSILATFDDHEMLMGSARYIPYF